MFSGSYVFTVGASFLVVLLCVLAGPTYHKSDRKTVVLTDDEVRTAILHARHDVRLIAYLLCGVIIMLGVVADRVGSN